MDGKRIALMRIYTQPAGGGWGHAVWSGVLRRLVAESWWGWGHAAERVSSVALLPKIL